MSNVNVARAFYAIALVLFVLAIFSVTLGTLNLLAAGFAFLAAGLLVSE